LYFDTLYIVHCMILVTQEKRELLCKVMLDNLEENYLSCVHMASLLTDGMVIENDINDYINVLIQSDYCPMKERIVGALSSSIWLYKDVGICGKVEKSTIPAATKAQVETVMTKRSLVLWPLYIPGKRGHWALAVIYTKSKRVALLDSSIDPKVHASIFAVSNLTTHREEKLV
jgi:hypothetical protein